MHCANSVTPPRCQAFECAWTDAAYDVLGITRKMSPLLPANMQSSLCLLITHYNNARMRSQ